MEWMKYVDCVFDKIFILFQNPLAMQKRSWFFCDEKAVIQFAWVQFGKETAVTEEEIWWIQWNLSQATIELYYLSRQVVFEARGINMILVNWEYMCLKKDFCVWLDRFYRMYRQTSNIRCTLVGKVGAAPTTSSFST